VDVPVEVELANHPGLVVGRDCARIGRVDHADWAVERPLPLHKQPVRERAHERYDATPARCSLSGVQAHKERRVTEWVSACGAVARTNITTRAVFVVGRACMQRATRE
jgi:hypothetical protein